MKNNWIEHAFVRGEIVKYGEYFQANLNSNSTLSSELTVSSSSTLTPLASAKFTITGHSLSDNPLPDYIETIATSQGKSVQWNQQNTPGAPLQLHTKGNDTNLTTWPGYSTGKNKVGSNTNMLSEIASPQAITGNYDTLILLERHDSLGVFSYHNTIRYARHYHERLIAANPSAKTYISHAWWSVSKNNPAQWVAFERGIAMAWKGIASRINASLVAESRSDRVDYLPAGLALAELVEQATTGNVAGITQGNSLATMNTIFFDDVHLLNVGVYYMACVYYASIYKSSPVGAAYPVAVTSTQAASLQNIAWNFVSNYYQNNTLPTLEAIRADAANFSTIYGNYPGQWMEDPENPGNVIYVSQPQYIASNTSLYGGTSPGSPFYYDAATDSSFWFPAP